ncbi:M20 family metallo-hydrolase [Lacicoccus qingdaonensis]|uniref:Allantoate deiminase/N-carbamoyl-L-amino-acid hydrolase n=1 Tax=Lacicoccus qingdaonensis TaxID=576118 RepID=A0A1G9JB93_9BACL|nr:M20 family metallo-hydrolase [Salinicoccus qingdaonensis]SDL34476.1 allantoate deiminase/N-carbamoyl-L-amino-acid hydrolase [Salinicoccus qingdaonensis]
MISKDRLQKRIELLAQIGKTEIGGVSRIALTKEYKEGLDLVTNWMEEAGMTVRLDEAGNLIGRKEGTNPELKAIALGSHIDSVDNGGKYDGVIGVLGGIEVVQHLKEESITNKRSLEVIAFCEEEGSRFQSGGVFGSRAMVGNLLKKDLEVTDDKGNSRYEVLKDFGLDPDNISNAIRNKEEFDLYLEMHIEQGPILIREDIPVGIVTGITGLSLTEVTFHGEANHVGGTPMDLRYDALLGASETALAVEEIVNEYGGNAVGTAATMEVIPSQVNIIPGRVSTVIDIRDTDYERREAILKKLEAKVKEISTRRNLGYQLKSKLKANPALSAQHILDTMKKKSKELGISTFEMPSGGGHDAQLMAEITDMAMVFVRSENGSHNPDEYAKPEDIKSGTDLLMETALYYVNR